MPNIHVEMFAGHTADQKRDLARELTGGFVRACDSPGDLLHVVTTEAERGHWDVGGKLSTSN